MKIEKQRNAELTQLGELIENMSVGMLTNIHKDGALVSRPMLPLEMDADGVVWFFVDATTTSEKHLNAVNLSFSDEGAGTYVSISGRGEIDLDRARMNRMWTADAKPWFPDGPSSPDLALLMVVPNAAEYWDAPHSRMVRMFVMAAAVVTGQPVVTGDHDTLTDLSKDASRDPSSSQMDTPPKPAWDESSKLSSTVEAD
jgi:general stress protein 26